MQTVFRVQTRKKTRSREQQETDSPDAVRSRRSHRKSRYGCRNCKRRRVKCDENLEGGCGNCERHGIICDYIQSGIQVSTARISSNTSSESPVDLSQSMPWTLVKQSHANTRPCRSPPFVSPVGDEMQQPNDVAPILQTLAFFEAFTCSTVTTTDGLNVFRDSILALSHHHDYLLHAILGMSAAHLRVMNGPVDNQQQCQRYQRTESYHWHRAIKQYRIELNNEASPEQIDALITTSMLLGLHNFQVMGSEDTSFVYAPKAQRQAKLQWLVVPMGFPAVLRHVRKHITSSVWFSIFNNAAPAEHGWTIERETANGIFADFVAICSDEHDVDDDRNPYKHALMDLFALLQIESPTMQEMAQIVAFMSRLNGGFQNLLVALDSKALLILLYWLAILEKLGLWWAKGRATQEARAIIEHLGQNHDDRIRDLLETPRMMFMGNIRDLVMLT